MPANILIGADLVPTKSNLNLFQEGNAEKLIGRDLQAKLNTADFTIFNLEVPLTDKTEPITKCGPNLIAQTATIKGLQAINPHFFGLANNHILDQSTQGLDSTLALLQIHHLAYAGAGKNLAEARKPFVKDVQGIKVGIYCCAEHEFTIAGDNTPGANPFDPLESLDHVAELEKQVDYVIVLYHGGKEHYRYPSPYLQKVCRKFVDKGADLVVCQHSHCIGAKEEWHNGTIIYGQGNFLFDNSESEFWQTSLLIDLSLTKDEHGIQANIGYLPLRKHKEKVRLAEANDAEQILRAFYTRSNEITDLQKVFEHYQEFANEYLPNYLWGFMGKKSLVTRALNKLSGYRYYKWLVKQNFSKPDLAAVRNFAECEAHRELLIQGINNHLQDR